MDLLRIIEPKVAPPSPKITNSSPLLEVFFGFQSPKLLKSTSESLANDQALVANQWPKEAAWYGLAGRQ